MDAKQLEENEKHMHEAVRLAKVAIKGCEDTGARRDVLYAMVATVAEEALKASVLLLPRKCHRESMEMICGEALKSVEEFLKEMANENKG